MVHICPAKRHIGAWSPELRMWTLVDSDSGQQGYTLGEPRHADDGTLCGPWCAADDPDPHPCKGCGKPPKEYSSTSGENSYGCVGPDCYYVGGTQCEARSLRAWNRDNPVGGVGTEPGPAKEFLNRCSFCGKPPIRTADAPDGMPMWMCGTPGCVRGLSHRDFFVWNEDNPRKV